MAEEITSEKHHRWEKNVFFRDKESKAFFDKHFSNEFEKKKTCVILGLGFDLRMNLGVKEILRENNKIDLDIILVSFRQEKDNSSSKYERFVKKNHTELKELTTESNINILEVSINKTGKKREIEAAKAITEELLSNYTDIFLDISSLPRSIYFSIAGKILSLIDASKITEPNFFIITSENTKIDLLIKEEGISNDLTYQFGFGAGIELLSASTPKIWFPITAENKTLQFRSAVQFIEPAEICPLLPFPSADLRRSDDIFLENYDLFFNELQIEPQNIMYVPEQNPFETYKKIIKAVENYNDSLIELGGCKIVISNFSSKLLSIGALLAAHDSKSEAKKSIAILNVNSKDYKVTDEDLMEELVSTSQLFVTWLTGDPYK